MAIFRISGVWHVGWWNLITSVRLIQVVNNRNDHFRYFLGVRVRLLKVLCEVNKGNKFWDFGYCPLNTGFTVILFQMEEDISPTSLNVTEESSSRFKLVVNAYKCFVESD